MAQGCGWLLESGGARTGKTTERKEPGTRGEPQISRHRIWASAQELGGPTCGLDSSRLQFTAWRAHRGPSAAPVRAQHH